MALGNSAILVAGTVAIGIYAVFMLWLSVLIVRSNFRRKQVLSRLRNRFKATTELASLHWVRIIGTMRSGAVGEQSFSTQGLMIAFHSAGLCIRVQELMSPIVNMPTACVPWQFVACVSTSKFGFFKVEFTISGFDDGVPLLIAFESTDQRVGKVLRECLEAINPTGASGAALE